MNYLNDILQNIGKIFQWWVIISPWEKGIRTRFGKNVKVLEPGIHFKAPVFDCVFIQTIRSRNISLTIKTLSTMDAITISIGAVVSYSIKDIFKLYNTIHHPEMD